MQKAAIVRRHLSGKELVSKLADEFGVQPSQIHLWVKQVLEVAERAFERSSGQRKGEGAKDRKTEHLEAKIVQKNEVIAELMLENHPDAKPRIISDNGPQFIAKDFKLFIRLTGITRVRTSPYYPQSNGKLEEARRRVSFYVDHYNHVRLHSVLGDITPADKLNGIPFHGEPGQPTWSGTTDDLLDDGVAARIAVGLLQTDGTESRSCRSQDNGSCVGEVRSDHPRLTPKHLTGRHDQRLSPSRGRSRIRRPKAK